MALLLALSLVPGALGPPAPANAVSTLLNMIGTGSDVSTTVTLAQSIAHGRFTQTVMQSLGEVVTKTKHTQNYERSLHMWLRRGNFAALVPEPYNFQLTA